MVRRVATTFLPPVLIDRHSDVPLYAQLYEWFRGAIIERRLKPGQQVPSTRSLASELRISRIPLLHAYEQLRIEGYLKTVVGGGTRVAEILIDEGIGVRRARGRDAVLPAPAGPAPRRLSTPWTAIGHPPRDRWPPRFGPFRMSLPALDQFPVRTWSKLVTRHARGLSKEVMAYGNPLGYLPLREAIADYVGMVRAVRCDASQVLITSGSQQGLQLAAQVLLNSGDAVCLEEPGYPGAHLAFASVGARMVPVAVDGEGLDVAALMRQGNNARAVYITPSHQYPLGTTLSAQRRVQLLQWARHTGAWVVEDDYDSEYRFASPPVGALQGMDADARVIYLGTFSKVMFPALRLGYLVVPKDLVPAFSGALDAAGIFTSPLIQLVLTDFIREGHLARHIRRMRLLYAERRGALVEALSRHFGSTLEVFGIEAGMHLAAIMRDGTDDRDVARHAAATSLSVMPLSTCYVGPPQLSGLVLGYGGASVPQIQDATRKLRDCMRIG